MNDASGTDTPLLRLEGVSKHFGPVVALDDVSFEVRAGEAVALLGDNGAGKSTLIKILSGSLEPSGGRLYFDGRPVVFDNPADAKALGIETVYQDLSLCPNSGPESRGGGQRWSTCRAAGARRSSFAASSPGAAGWSCWTSRSQRSACGRRGAVSSWSSRSRRRAWRSS